MSLYLTLLPFTNDAGHWAYAHSALGLGQDYRLFDAIQELRSMPVPAKFNTYLCRDDKYEEAHYGNTQQDPYGDAIQWVLAGELVKLSVDPKDTLTVAAWAYLLVLDPSTKVALYWY